VKNAFEYEVELAALREELAECKKQKAWWVDSAKTLDQRLTAAEQRNAELKVFDQFVGYLLDHCEGETIYEESLQRWLAESIEKNKPTESGARE
jgi:hypothetical protein